MLIELIELRRPVGVTGYDHTQTSGSSSLDIENGLRLLQPLLPPTERFCDCTSADRAAVFAKQSRDMLRADGSHREMERVFGTDRRNEAACHPVTGFADARPYDAGKQYVGSLPAERRWLAEFSMCTIDLRKQSLDSRIGGNDITKDVDGAHIAAPLRRVSA